MASEAGFLANYSGTCARCYGDYVAGRDRIISRPNGYIHAGCASGADDE